MPRHAVPPSVALGFALAVACSGSREPAPPPASSSDASTRTEPSAPPPSPSPAPPPANTEPASPPPAPPPGRVREALGAPTVAILEGATSVEVAALNHRDTHAPDANGAWPLDRMTMYRIRGTPRPVEAALASQIVTLVLDEDSYDWLTMRRCARRDLVGFRFRRGDERADMTFGQNCEQVEIVSFGADGHRLVDWAGWYTPVRERITDLIRQATGS